MAFATRNRLVGALAAAVVERPRRVLWRFMALHAALWILTCVVLWPNLPNDDIEMLAWGQEWQLGFWKLPPLPAWIAEIAHIATFGSHWALLVLSRLFVCAAFWATWKLSAEIVGETRAVLAVIALAGVGSFGYDAMTFNHDVAELPFWALTGWTLHRALRRRLLADWALLGLWMGLGMLAKYQFVTFLVPLAGFVAIHPASRGCLRTLGPYVAIGVASVVVAPNLAWLLAHDFFGPLEYALDRVPTEAGAWSWVTLPLEFVAGQAALIGCAVAYLVALRGRSAAVVPLPEIGAFDRWYVAVLALGPFLLTLAVTIVTGHGARTTWGFAMWGFIGTFGVLTIAPLIDAASLRRGFAVAIGLFAAVYAGTLVEQVLVSPYRGHPQSFHFPGAELAGRIESGWAMATGNAPLRYVAGTIWLSGNVSYYSAARPSVYTDATTYRSPWIDLADLRRRGVVLLWNGRAGIDVPPPRRYTAQFPEMIVQPRLTLTRNLWTGTVPYYIEWAIVPPAAE